MKAKPPLRFRKLRIAWSLAWGVVTVLLCVLWLRSYWWSDQFHLQATRWVGGSTNRGWLVLHWLDVSKRNYVEIGYHCKSIEVVMWADVEKSTRGAHLYSIVTTPEGYVLLLPLWFPATVLAVFAAASWLRWRFSLRTLLIATALTAIGLELVVWLARK